MHALTMGDHGDNGRRGSGLCNRTKQDGGDGLAGWKATAWPAGGEGRGGGEHVARGSASRRAAHRKVRVRFGPMVQQRPDVHPCTAHPACNITQAQGRQARMHARGRRARSQHGRCRAAESAPCLKLTDPETLTGSGDQKLGITGNDTCGQCVPCAWTRGENGVPQAVVDDLHELEHVVRRVQEEARDDAVKQAAHVGRAVHLLRAHMHAGTRISGYIPWAPGKMSPRKDNARRRGRSPGQSIAHHGSVGQCTALHCTAPPCVCRCCMHALRCVHRRSHPLTAKSPAHMDSSPGPGTMTGGGTSGMVTGRSM